MLKSPGAKTAALIFLILFISASVPPVCAEVVKGTISITSDPEGAEIYLNDEYLGFQTNKVITDVYPGIHFVRLEMPGYRTWEKIFEVKEGKVTYISHVMEPVVGDALSFSTKPEGAAIYIDGEFYGITNTVIYRLPAGQHSILLSLDNYSDYAKTVMVDEGMSQSVAHTFEPVPTTGRIVFESVPSNAQVFLNGEYKGTTRLTLDDVLPGTYDILIKKEGYDDWAGKVDVAAGKISEVRAELLLSKVSLSFDSVPQGADVRVDGVFYGTTPLEVQADQGVREIEVSKFGYETVRKTADIGPLGASFSFVLVSMAPQAIEQAEAAVAKNLAYGPKRAEKLVMLAVESYNAGDSENAIKYAESAILSAYDVDSDGVLNPDDISPNVNNLLIYVFPFVILFLLSGLFVRDFSTHRIKAEISVDIPDTVREDDMLARGHVSADVSGGDYRGFVCTVYIDGVSVEHFTEPGRYDIMLAGKSPGVHEVSAHLQVAKKRYGKLEKKAGKTFTVEPSGISGQDGAPENKSPGDDGIIDAGEYSRELEEYYEDEGAEAGGSE